MWRGSGSDMYSHKQLEGNHRRSGDVDGARDTIWRIVWWTFKWTDRGLLTPHTVHNIKIVDGVRDVALSGL